jgi:outer membrane protein assembly factor BamE (lipoprotein component of BamABCDE complex)
LLTLVTLFAVLLNNSCCPLPPGNLMSPRGVIADKVIKSLQQEGTTREDLLFLVGEPDMRGMQDRRFIYTWTAEYSYYRNIVLETHYLVDPEKQGYGS